MLDQYKRFIIEDYGKKNVFASFLPGIAGKKGIPLWSFYCNRGQAITSFGSGNKDNSIMEFYPAQTAYQLVRTHGFRTFMKTDGEYSEAFTDENTRQSMFIGFNTLELTEDDTYRNIKTEVRYCILPEEHVGALVRIVRVTNEGDKKRAFEVVDGMPALIPYGVSLSDLKEMGQTVKAWMQVEDHESGLPYYRVRASIVDSISVSRIEKGNFAIAHDEDGRRLSVIVDPDIIFGYDNSMITAVGFRDTDDIIAKPQVTANKVPCAFFSEKAGLEPGESMTFYEIYGLASDKGQLISQAELIENEGAPDYYWRKWDKASGITDEIIDVIKTHTGNNVFDAYCEATFLDNSLRGGFPTKLGDKVFYLYSRKHGDIERDYNYFTMAPEFYTQGNANYRDICQNRRSDILFTPFTGDMNAKMFMSLIQSDAFNPLKISEARFILSEEKAGDYDVKLRDVLVKPFTPGELSAAIIEAGLEKDLEEIVNRAVTDSKALLNSEFGEGYWTDHWEYTLDLVESYLKVFPDKKEKLIFDDRDCTYFDTKVFVNPRNRRYVETDKGLRQYNPIRELPHKAAHSKLMTTPDGTVVKTNIAEKILLLCAIKFMTLDSYGMGVEMEGGRPGWYDALNGLPGLFGSSLCESMELCRHIEFMLDALENDLPYKSVTLSEEVASLYDSIAALGLKSWDGISTWNALNDIKEAYREKTIDGFGGSTRDTDKDLLIATLKTMHDIVKQGFAGARRLSGGEMPAYFAFEATDYKVTEKGIIVNKFEPITIPTFLESYVHNFRMKHSLEKKKELYREVKNSKLYDDVLQMYKVNEPLNDTSFELGRTRAFTPGWLENESVWLHMEYKYLLELIKNGLYEEFAEDLRKCAIPFLDPDVYGRSTLENSSFIASSANCDPGAVGRGFVARLSGSTAEFIDIWQIMMFGKDIFRLDNGELKFDPNPVIPSYLIGDDKRIEATLLGSIKVTYNLSDIKDYFPGDYEIRNMRFVLEDGTIIDSIPAEDIREGKIREITADLF